MINNGFLHNAVHVTYGYICLQKCIRMIVLYFRKQHVFSYSLSFATIVFKIFINNIVMSKTKEKNQRMVIKNRKTRIKAKKPD